MKNFTLPLLIIFIIFQSCNKNTPISVEPNPKPHNLVVNPIFQINGESSLAGWTFRDSLLFSLSADVPENGAGSSLGIGIWLGPYKGWPANCIYTTASGIQGVHTYTLSFWGKYRKENIYGGPGGVFTVYVNRPGTINSREFLSVTVTDTSWSFYTLTDTLRTSSSDSLFINIFGNSGQNTGQTYFNTCIFEILD